MPKKMSGLLAWMRSVLDRPVSEPASSATADGAAGDADRGPTDARKGTTPRGLARLTLKSQVTLMVLMAIFPTGLILSAYFYLVISPNLRQGIEAQAQNLAGFLADSIVTDGRFNEAVIDQAIGRILVQANQRLAYVMVYRGDDPVPFRAHMETATALQRPRQAAAISRR